MNMHVQYLDSRSVCICFFFCALQPLQHNLRRAAKARIDRMAKPHSKRKELDAPDWLKNEWSKGDKNNMADLFRSLNFDKDCVFILCMKSQLVLNNTSIHNWIGQSMLPSKKRNCHEYLL